MSSCAATESQNRLLMWNFQHIGVVEHPASHSDRRFRKWHQMSIFVLTDFNGNSQLDSITSKASYVTIFIDP